MALIQKNFDVEKNVGCNRSYLMKTLCKCSAGRRHRETLIPFKEDPTIKVAVERKGYRRRHRPSISFEDSVPTIPRQRLKQLQFLRTVHSAQAR